MARFGSGNRSFCLGMGGSSLARKSVGVTRREVDREAEYMINVGLHVIRLLTSSRSCNNHIAVRTMIISRPTNSLIIPSNLLGLLLLFIGSSSRGIGVRGVSAGGYSGVHISFRSFRLLGCRHVGRRSFGNGAVMSLAIPPLEGETHSPAFSSLASSFSAGVEVSY